MSISVSFSSQLLIIVLDFLWGSVLYPIVSACGSSVQLKSPIIILCVLCVWLWIVYTTFQKEGMSLLGAYTVLNICE